MNSYSLIDPYKPSSADDIAGNQYTQLMNWALDHSDAVMLVYENGNYRRKKRDWPNIMYVRTKLSKHRIYTRSTPTSWPGTTISYPDPARIRKLYPNSYYEPILYIDFYAVTPEIREFVLSAGHIRGWLAPRRPEDIAFFTKGKCWFFTTIHEGYYTIRGLHPGTREKLESLGIKFKEYPSSEENLWIEPGLLPETANSK